MQVKTKDRHILAVEKAQEKARRLAAIEHQRTLQQQMRDKLRRDYLDGIDMVERERRLNKPLLTQAEQTVHEPHPIAINLP